MDLGAGGNLTIDGKAKVTINAASELALKCGGATIVLTSGGEISIKGTKITVKGDTIKIDGSGDVSIKGSTIKEQ
jgi:type VI secretion system secreted protein VgrG